MNPLRRQRVWQSLHVSALPCRKNRTGKVSHSILLAGLLMAGLVGVLLWRSIPRESYAVAPGPAVPSPQHLNEGPGPVLGPGDRAPADTPAPSGTAPPNIGEFLSEYWGDQWNELRTAAIDAGIDPDAPLPFTPPDWNEIRDEALTKMQLSEPARKNWFNLIDKTPKEFSADWVGSHFNVDGIVVDDFVLASLTDIVARHSSEIDLALETYCDAIDDAIEDIWRRDAFSKGPFFAPSGSKQVPMVTASSFAYRGWVVSFIVRTDEYPFINELLETAQTEVQERDDEMRAFLDSQRR